MSPIRYVLFLGCLIPTRFPQFEYLARKTLAQLGIELVDAEGFTCCPDPVRFGSADRFTWLVLAARNLSIAQRLGLPILTLCPTCTFTLSTANQELQEQPMLARKVNQVLEEVGHNIHGPVTVKHFLKVIYEDVGLERLSDEVRRPLAELKIACHSGCHERSPTAILQFDNLFNPVKMDKVLDAMGAFVVDYQEKSLCCGAPLTLGGALDDSLTVVKRKVEDMKRYGAEALSVACAFCFQQFEIGQVMALRKGLTDVQLPVFHFLELLALAMGWSLDDIGFKKHKIKKGQETLTSKFG